jgi:hypothetical protein
MYDLLAGFYELYYSTPFSDEMYREGLYGIVFLWTFVAVVLVTLIYYVILDKVSLSRWYHWLFFMGIALVLSFFIGFYLPQDTFYVNNIEVPGADFVAFGFVNVLMGLLITIFASAVFRSFFSNNCRSTPYPQ